MIRKNFKIVINIKGYHTKRCDLYPIEYRSLESILITFPIISELQWFKSEVIKAKEKGKKEYTGLNEFICYVTGETCELGYQNNRDHFVSIPTPVVLDFIDDAIKFHEIYDSGGIPGIIPDSKKHDWIIVPKKDWITVPREYVKEEYWSVSKNVDNDEE